MGAIAGLFYPNTPKPVDPARVRAMAVAMAARGPDGAGEWTAPGVGFAHRRLATVGGTAAAQPVATDDLRYAAMLDGTILNHAALREELRRLGHRFRGDGDAEVVLRGFAEWGPSLLDRLMGGFAIAVHDAATQTLFLARDRLGAKPLHMAMLPDGALIFASTLGGVVAHPLLRRAPDAAAVADYLTYGHVPDDACLVAGVGKLPAGHFLLVERGRPAQAPRRWWTLRDTAPTPADALLPELRAAVLRQAGGAEVDALLLGGAGDAAIVALLAEARTKAVRTVGTAAGEEVAARFATAHRRVDATEAAAIPDDLVAAFDEPCVDPAAIYALVAARACGPVALAGGGAALLFGGARWRWFAMRQAWRRRWPGLGETAGDHGAIIGALPAGPIQALWSAAGRAAWQGYEPARRYGERLAVGDPLTAAMHADVSIRLPAQVLTIADRAGMAAGVEWRSPFADPALVSFALNLPRRVRASRTPALTHAMARHLPALPLDPPSAPVDAWLKEAGERLARSTILAELGWFDLHHIARLAEAHRAGGADHGALLWRMVLLERSLSRLFWRSTFA